MPFGSSTIAVKSRVKHLQNDPVVFHEFIALFEWNTQINVLSSARWLLLFM